MRWYDSKKYKPAVDGIYIARIYNDGEPDGEVYFEQVLYLNGEFKSEFIDDHNVITHFAIPGAIESKE